MAGFLLTHPIRNKSLMKSSKLPFLMAVLLGITVPILADEAADLDKQVEQIDQVVPEPAAPKEVVESVSEETLQEVSKKTRVPVEKLEKQQAQTKMGSGSLYIANVIAAKSGKSFEEIAAAKKSGKGWGQIAKDNGVKLGPLVSETKKLEKQQRDRVAQHKQKAGKDAKGGKSQASDREKGSPTKGAKGQGKPDDQGGGKGGQGKGGKK